MPRLEMMAWLRPRNASRMSSCWISGLPDLDGLTVLKRIREWSKVPILILSVRDQEEEKIAALDSGADDYVTKPFNSGELLARLRAALRHGQPQGADAIFRAGDLEVDLSKRLVLKERRGSQTDAHRVFTAPAAGDSRRQGADTSATSEGSVGREGCGSIALPASSYRTFAGKIGSESIRA